MAITEAWTDPDTLEKAAGDVYRAADVNSVLGNLKFLHGGPRVTLVRNTSFDVDSATDTTIAWSSALVDSDSGWDSASPSVYVVQQAGVYMVSLRLLWPNSTAGDYRRWRLLRNGDPCAGNRIAATAFAEHGNSVFTSLSVGDSMSIDVRHDAGSTLTVTSESLPVWRSPIFMLQWIAPTDGSE